ncbi:MAG: hypothetical protein Q8M24_15560 [Pseudolabrys sp.]|nr:hypothetical protein [Pseudolabrys sp.]MDP2296860.1 hypothetical protein [Pseudolabrys sp.]
MTTLAKSDFETFRHRGAHATAGDYLEWCLKVQRKLVIDEGARIDSDIANGLARLAVTVEAVPAATLDHFDSVLATQAFGPRAFWAALCDERAWRFTGAEEFLKNLLRRFPS